MRCPLRLPSVNRGRRVPITNVCQSRWQVATGSGARYTRFDPRGRHEQGFQTEQGCQGLAALKCLRKHRARCNLIRFTGQGCQIARVRLT